VEWIWVNRVLSGGRGVRSEVFAPLRRFFGYSRVPPQGKTRSISFTGKREKPSHMRKTIAVLTAIAALAVTAAPAAAYDAKDCSDFPTQKAAQKWFKKHNPKADPSGLDADHDGIACESNA